MSGRERRDGGRSADAIKTSAAVVAAATIVVISNKTNAPNTLSACDH